jgi:hypothetical protein
LIETIIISAITRIMGKKVSKAEMTIAGKSPFSKLSLEKGLSSTCLTGIS